MCDCPAHLKLVDLLQSWVEAELIPVDAKRRPPALKTLSVLGEEQDVM